MKNPKRLRGFYEINGKQLPSVTTVIGKTLAKGIGFSLWYGTHGTSECNRISAEAKSFGSAMHKVIANYLEGETPNTDKMATNVLRAWGTWLDYWKKNPEKVLDVEKVIHNDAYAGTCDLLTKDNVVVDWKFSGGLYPAHKIQLGAYARLTGATKGKIVRVAKDEINIEVLEMNEEELKEAAKVFDSLLHVFWWLRKK